MRLNKLILTNFRGVAKLKLDFPHQTTLLVGVNGVGKSAILDSLAIAFSHLAWRINENPNKSRPIASRDLKIGERHASIAVESEFQGQGLAWLLAYNKGGLPRNRSDLLGSKLDALNEAIKTLHQNWSHVEENRQEPFDLPLTVYYDVHRAVVETPMRVREHLQLSPFEAYRDALDHGGADFKRFFIWFRNREDWENEQRRDKPDFRDRFLSAVRTATEAFTGFTNIRIRRNPLRMTVEKRGLELDVEQLSDGEKCLFALVGDLARRLALLNPKRKNPLEGDGVVLIDEIDLHLHPKWQREIVPSLEKTFPNCQFVVSTHSPQILSHVRADQVWLLRQEPDGLHAFHPQVTFGLDSSRLLEEVMDVAQRESSIEDALNQLFRMIEESSFAQARELLASLKQRAPGMPEYGRAEALMKRKEVIGR